MAKFCGNCGASVSDNVSLCHYCGSVVDGVLMVCIPTKKKAV